MTAVLIVVRSDGVEPSAGDIAQSRCQSEGLPALGLDRGPRSDGVEPSAGDLAQPVMGCQLSVLMAALIVSARMGTSRAPVTSRECCHSDGLPALGLDGEAVSELSASRSRAQLNDVSA